MITGYCSNGETVTLSVADELVALRPDIVWVDLVEPSKAEDLMMEKLLGISIPTRDDLKDIEPSSRLYTEADAVFMTASLVYRSETDIPDLTDVAFILHGGRLVTIRYAEPRAFALFKAAMHRIPGGCPNGVVMLTRLLETIADRTAEILEQAVGKIDDLSLQVFGDKAVVKRRPPHFLEARLRDVAGHHRLVAKTRDSLASLSRLLTFVYTVPEVQADKDSRELCRSISRDIQTLSEHASFISGNITFLLDASLGLINVEQNAIIKIFSIASVVLLPPTLVASVYGMNFRVMPELEWPLGYPWALAAMVISAVIPFFFFRWKGWL
ncbi:MULTISPECIES: magnesium transporter CorA family protein [Ensifer]|jgi:magnesium transporter|uniref:Magnesium transport protein CorA n=1 Tax=Ensifer canadensis TaxID=555315 RepID=A0AAW4FFU8_9HYPH|nr:MULTISPECIES: magnesium transporter CorA family protein [Ensifer]AHK43569.1 putative magnesium/cobalt transport protein [Ensifer adhaerens OV14]MDP9628233.1 magnesium transporter [Ensifer adhaerens]KQU71770.1 magnesium transporter [Ensifer sp. Root31]KQW62602.1 magnesium transporter [Ensifer sp. Root1252]KQW84718.1 magnesium transporter [Ensifer sp. Root127]